MRSPRDSAGHRLRSPTPLLPNNLLGEPRTVGLIGGVLALLLAATVVGKLLRRQTGSGLDPVLVQDFNARVRSWWIMSSLLAAAFFLGETATVVLFGLLSFWALREFITLTPTRPGDHRTLFWVFFVFTPAQYLLVRMGEPMYGLYSVLIPVYAFLFIPARAAIAGDHKRFLERSAKIQAGLMICVYCLSHAPALLSLPLKTAVSSSGEMVATASPNARLLFYFIVVVQLNDVLAYGWSKLLGKHLIAPGISHSKTWEGFLAALASSTVLGTLLWWATPFEPWEAAGMSALISVTGFAGTMTMSAIKRDRGVEDYGVLIRGHSGVLDRIDSVCFAAPVFFHVTRFFFTDTG